MKHGLRHGYDDVIKEDSVMVKVKFNHKCDNVSLEGHYLGRKFKNSRWLEGVKIGQPQSTIENTKIHMVRGMMWLALRYMKAKESEFILPHLRLLRKLGLDEIRSMYLNELGKMSYVVGVTAGNKGLNMYQTCKKIDVEGHLYVVNCFVKLFKNYYLSGTTKRAKGVEVDAYQDDILALLLGLVEGVKEVLSACSLLKYDEISRDMVGKDIQDKYSSKLFFAHEKSINQEDGMDAGFALLHYKTVNVIEFEWSFVHGVELSKVLQMLELLQLALAIKHLYMEVLFQERMIKNRLQAVDKWLVKWKWKKLCGRKKNFWKIFGTNSRDPWGQGSFKGRVLLCVGIYVFLT
ncbi:hypothetical protein Tco_1165813 [Tanacetum coccineum]